MSKVRTSHIYVIDRQSSVRSQDRQGKLSDLESMLSASPSPDRVCMKLAQILRVRRSEVALLRLDKGSLRFIFPPELRSAGVLPLGGSAVAARTAATRTPLLSNTFMRVKHASLFEAVKLGAEKKIAAWNRCRFRKSCRFRCATRPEHVMGVVQISRKGLDASCAAQTSRPKT